MKKFIRDFFTALSGCIAVLICFGIFCGICNLIGMYIDFICNHFVGLSRGIVIVFNIMCIISFVYAFLEYLTDDILSTNKEEESQKIITEAKNRLLGAEIESEDISNGTPEDK